MVVLTGELGAHVEVFRPFAACPSVVFGRTAARSEAFGELDAAGGALVLVGSAAGDSPGDVAVRARGELVERVCNVVSGRRAEAAARVVATYHDLRRRGVPALDPASWRQRVDQQDPEGRPGEELRLAPMLWVPGVSLVSGSEMLVPAGAVFLRHRPPAGCAPLLRAGSTGLSAHPSLLQATRHALLELLERDLVWRSWYLTVTRRSLAGGVRRPPMKQIPAGEGELGATLHPALDALRLDVAVLALAGPPGVTCVVTGVHEPGRVRQSFGARCMAGARPSAEPLAGAIRSAVYEALMVRWSMGTSVARQAWAALRQRDRPSEPAWPLTALEHALLTFHAQDSLGCWLTGATGGAGQPGRADAARDAGGGWPEPGEEDPPPWPGAGEPADAGVDEAQLARLLADHTGEDVVAVETTVASMASGGEVVLRVVAPGARRLLADDRCDALAGGGLVSPDHAGRGCANLPHPFG